VDEGVSGRFGVKTTNKGLMGRGGCGNRFGEGGKEGVEGDTVEQNLVLAIGAAVAD